MFHRTNNKKRLGTQLNGIEQLERKELFASLLADTTDTGDQADVANTTGYTFYGRYFAPATGAAESQDGSDLLIVNNGDGSDYVEGGATTTYQYDSLSRLIN